MKMYLMGRPAALPGVSCSEKRHLPWSPQPPALTGVGLNLPLSSGCTSSPLKEIRAQEQTLAVFSRQQGEANSFV